MTAASVKKLQAEIKDIFETQQRCFDKQQKCFEYIEKLQASILEINSTINNTKTVVEFCAITVKDLGEKGEQWDEKIENLERTPFNCGSTQPENGLEIDSTKKQINDLKLALDDVKKQTNELSILQDQSRTKIQETDMQNQSAVFQQPTVINSICNELQLRQRKRRNLVMFGLKESSADMEDVEALVRDVGVMANVNSVYRVGATVENRPRPLVVHFATEYDRDQVINNLRNLKGQTQWNRISVVPDLTKIQCTQEKIMYKQLLEEIKQKNEENTQNGIWKIVGSRGNRRTAFIKL